MSSTASTPILGTTWSLAPDGDFAVVNGRIALAGDTDCLIQRLQNRLACDKGALLLHPDFGSGFGARIGALMTDNERTDLLNNLKHDTPRRSWSSRNHQPLSPQHRPDDPGPRLAPHHHRPGPRKPNLPIPQPGPMNLQSVICNLQSEIPSSLELFSLSAFEPFSFSAFELASWRPQ